MDAEVARADSIGDGNSVRVKTHLGNILRVGDSVLGYDLESIVTNGE